MFDDIFDGDVGLESAEVKSNPVIVALESHRDDIQARGFSKTQYYALEELVPGSMSHINPAMLTINRSSTKQDVAVESIGDTIAFVARTLAAGVAVFAVVGFIKTIFEYCTKGTKGSSLGAEVNLNVKSHKEMTEDLKKTLAKHQENLKATDASLDEAISQAEALLASLNSKGVGTERIHQYDNWDTATIKILDEALKRNVCAIPTVIEVNKWCRSRHMAIRDFEKISKNVIKSNVPAELLPAGIVMGTSGLTSAIVIDDIRGHERELVEAFIHVSHTFVDLKNLLTRKPTGTISQWNDAVIAQLKVIDNVIKKHRPAQMLIEKAKEKDGKYREELKDCLSGKIAYWHKVTPVEVHTFDPDKEARKILDVCRRDDEIVTAGKQVVSMGQILERAVKDIPSTKPDWMDEFFEGRDGAPETVMENCKKIRERGQQLAAIFVSLRRYLGNANQALVNIDNAGTKYKNAISKLSKASGK